MNNFGNGFNVCGAQQAGQNAMWAADGQQTQTINTQVAMDAVKQKTERQKLEADMKTKVFEITQDVTQNKQKVAQKAAEADDQLIRS